MMAHCYMLPIVKMLEYKYFGAMDGQWARLLIQQTLKRLEIFIQPIIMVYFHPTINKFTESRFLRFGLDARESVCEREIKETLNDGAGKNGKTNKMNNSHF